MGYEPHENLIAPARASAGLGRLAAGCAAIIAIFLLFSLAWSALQPVLLPPDRWPGLAEELHWASSPLAVLLNLYFFLFLLASVWLALGLVHNRGFPGLLGDRARALLQFRRSVLALAPLYAVLALLPFPADISVTMNIAFDRWILYLPAALLGLLIQVSAEEVLFRGYLQSQLAARFASPLVWIGGPSALFAVLHYDMQFDGFHSALIMIWAGAFAVIAADLTARSGTLGPAIGLHLFNNFSAILIIAPEGSFDGLALYTFPFSDADQDALLIWFPVEMMVLLCSWLTIRLGLRC